MGELNKTGANVRLVVAASNGASSICATTTPARRIRPLSLVTMESTSAKILGLLCSA